MPHTSGALWLSISGGAANTMLDTPLRRFLFTRMPTGIVVLNAYVTGFQELVDRTHAQFPELKILRYSNAQRVPEGSRVACTMFQHFLDNQTTEVLIRTNGKPKIVGQIGERTIFVDITSEAARKFIITHIVQQIAAHHVDGVAIDSFHAQLRDYKNYIKGADKAAEWPNACAAILDGLRSALPDRLVWFNGIWSFDGPEQVVAQSRLLRHAHGASVEFYGYDGTGRITQDTFNVFVQRINNVLAGHPDKPILVRGRSPGSAYYDYLPDLQYARYCYGCYLLGLTPGSFFNHGQSFQLTRRPRERTGGAAMFSYFDLPLGEPSGPAVANGTGGWSRAYKGGHVYVAPAEGAWQQWQVGFDAWTTTGEPHPWNSVLIVPSGDATILLRAMPAPPAFSLEADISDSTHEWLVDGVTGEYRYRYLTLSIRSTDLNSAVLVRFETNDEPRPFGILEVMPEGGNRDVGKLDYPYGYKTKLGAAHVRSGSSYPTNGAWTEFTINLEQDCEPYPCFRVISVKKFGRVSVGLIRLTEPVRIM